MATYQIVPASELWDRVKLLRLMGEANELEAKARRQERWAQKNRDKAMSLRQKIADIQTTLKAKQVGG